MKFIVINDASPTFSQVGPGEYAASFPAEHEGAYIIVVDTDYGCARAGFSQTFAQEFVAQEADLPRLKAAAAAAGGGVLERPEELNAEAIPAATVPSPLYRYLLGAAAVLLVIDVALRRIQSWRELMPAVITERGES